MLGILFILLSQVMVALNIVVSKLLIGSMPVFIVLFLRFFWGSLILLALAKPSGYSVSRGLFGLKLNKKNKVMLLLQALSAGFLFNTLMLIGLRYTTASMAGILTSTLPAIIAIGCFIFLREKLSFGKWMCVIFATLGIVVVNGSKIMHSGLNGSIVGDFLVLLSLVPEAAYYVMTKIHRNRLPTFFVCFWMNLINAVIYLPFALYELRHGLPHVSVLDWILTVVMGLVSIGFFVFWLQGARTVKATFAALLTATMPLYAVVLSWLVLGETLNGYQSLGMGLVLLSIAFSARA